MESDLVNDLTRIAEDSGIVRETDTARSWRFASWVYEGVSNAAMVGQKIQRYVCPKAAEAVDRRVAKVWC